MLTYDISGKNKYWSLCSHIRDDILRGRLKSGEKLPSKRSLADNLGVSTVTVQAAYEQLLAEGYIRSEERKGYFVERVNVEFYGEKNPPPAPKEQETCVKLDLAKGSAPSALFPFSVWSKLMRRVLSDCGEHLLERVPCDGDYELKSAISSYLYRARGIDADPRYIVVGAGAEYLYGVIVQLLGRDKLFAVENPGYGRISACYRLNGADCVCIGVKETGICCDEVERSNADVLHVSPSHQFPTGAVTPASGRARLISWARSSGSYIIEDDYDSEFRLYGKPLQSTFSLCPERVIYMNTFSKSLAPSMRMGYMVLPPAVYEKYRALFGHGACAVPLFEQKALAAMLDGGYFERHINRLRTHYREVHRVLLERAEELDCEITDTGSGLHFLVRFPHAPDDAYIKESAARVGIRVKCLSDYLLQPTEGAERTAVINYAGATVEQIKEIELC